MIIKVGQKYKHYKGNIYLIIAIGRNSETLEEMVVYQGFYLSKEFGLDPIWIRPIKIFQEQIWVDGEKVNRFELIEK